MEELEGTPDVFVDESAAQDDEAAPSMRASLSNAPGEE